MVGRADPQFTVHCTLHDREDPGKRNIVVDSGIRFTFYSTTTESFVISRPTLPFRGNQTHISFSPSPLPTPLAVSRVFTRKGVGSSPGRLRPNLAASSDSVVSG